MMAENVKKSRSKGNDEPQFACCYCCTMGEGETLWLQAANHDFCALNITDKVPIRGVS